VHEAYLKGRYHWIKRTREGHTQACRYFQEAIAKDPACATAYAGLADAVSIMSLWGLLPPEEGCGKARGLAQKALAFDHSLAEAHASLAWATLQFDYDFATAEKEFERAIELNPRYANAHHWFGMSLGMMGRYEEGYTELKRALRLDPHWSYIHFGLAFVHWTGRRYGQAIEQCEKALALDPNSVQALVWLGVCRVAEMKCEPAIAALERAVELSQGAPVAAACLGEAYAIAGSSDEAHRILLELSGRQLARYFVSRIYAALGKKSEAIEWLETAYQEHGEWMVMLKVDPRFDTLRDDPRFQDLMRRMNFPE
jgi:tetratricopeptide (TPR) repeat protein